MRPRLRLRAQSGMRRPAQNLGGPAGGACVPGPVATPRSPRSATTTLPLLGQGPRGAYLPLELPWGSPGARRPRAERSCWVPRCAAAPRASWLRSWDRRRGIRVAGSRQRDPGGGVQAEGSGQPDRQCGSGRGRDLGRRFRADGSWSEVQTEGSGQRYLGRRIRAVG